MSPRRFSPTAFCLVLFIATTASAADLNGTTRTYLTTRELTDGTRLTRLYEYLDVRTDSGGNDIISFNAGGWYRVDLQSENAATTDTGDLQYAYLTLRKRSANAHLNVGRVIVHEGVASSQLDGAYARTDLRGGFSVAAFGGAPVETVADTRSGDSVYGGRVAHGIPGIYAVGASYLHEKNDSRDYRKEEGVDVWIMPVRKLQIMGVSAYNAESRNWMQHQYTATLGPFAWFRLNLDASKTWYGEYFGSATLSAFTFPQIDPNEIVTAAGGSAVFAVGKPVTLTADFRTYDYQVQTGSATYAGGGIAYRGDSLSVGASAHRMNGPDAERRYDEQRAYVQMKVARADMTVDVVHVGFDQPINGEPDAWSGSAALGYSVTPRLRFVADGEYAKNPDFNRDVRGLVSMVYRFDVPLGGRPAPGSKQRAGSR